MVEGAPKLEPGSIDEAITEAEGKAGMDFGNAFEGIRDSAKIKYTIERMGDLSTKIPELSLWVKSKLSEVRSLSKQAKEGVLSIDVLETWHNKMDEALRSWRTGRVGRLDMKEIEKILTRIENLRALIESKTSKRGWRNQRLEILSGDDLKEAREKDLQTIGQLENEVVTNKGFKERSDLSIIENLYDDYQFRKSV